MSYGSSAGELLALCLLVVCMSGSEMMDLHIVCCDEVSRIGDAFLRRCKINVLVCQLNELNCAF